MILLREKEYEQKLNTYRKTLMLEIEKRKRTPNQIAADRTKNKSDAQLGEKTKTLLPCGCLFYEIGKEHTRCYYTLHDTSLIESMQFLWLEKLCEPARQQLLSIDEALEQIRTSKNQEFFIDEISRLKTLKKALLQKYSSKLDEYERAGVTLAMLELVYNGVIECTSG